MNINCRYNFESIKEEVESSEKRKKLGLEKSHSNFERN
jgi:hypothetical protein